MWSSGFKEEDAAGQYVLFATSDDGVRWSEAKPVMSRPDRTRLQAGGFWVHQGELLCLAAAYGSFEGEGVTENLQLLAYAWNPRAGNWAGKGVVHDDALIYCRPYQLPNGQTLAGAVQKESLLVRLNGKTLTGGEALEGGKLSMHLAVKKDAPRWRMDYLLIAPPLRIGRNIIEVSLNGGGSVPAEPLELLRLRLWVKYQ